MDTRARVVLTMALAMIGVVSIGLPGTAAARSQPTRVSRASPYAHCDDTGEKGKVFVNAETEPQVAANPLDPTNLIGVWQQDRWTTAASHGDAAGYSNDGGRTWHRTTLPFSHCTPGGLPFDRATDPWISIGPDGTAYAVGLSVSGFPLPGGRNAVVAATSTNGGKTWRRVRIIADSPSGAKRFHDKESVTADPTKAGVAYVVWDVGKATAAPHFRQPSLFSMTTDWGRHWTKPRVIAAGALDEASIDNQIVVDPASGTVYNFYSLFYCVCFSIPRIEFVKSTDGGQTWSARHVVESLDSMGVFDPNTGAFVRTADFGATVAIDPGNGTLYAVWQSPRFNGGHYDEIAISSSSDGGRHWKAPRRANRFTGRPAFLPTVAVSLQGVLGLTYYDFRHLKPGSPDLSTDLWLRTSWDRGATLSRDQHVAGPFNMNAAPHTEGPIRFIGDYMGLTSSFSTFVPFFVRTNCATGQCRRNRTDVYAGRFEPLPPKTPGATVGAQAPTWYQLRRADRLPIGAPRSN